MFRLILLWISIFIAFSFASSGVESPREVLREIDAGRYVFSIPQILQRTYDVSGQKSEWVLGTSILGAPDLSRESAGVSLVGKRFPMGISGLYTTRLTYDAFHPGLNGENGLLLEESTLAPLDTPITDIAWERSAFEGNAFRLEFRRQLVDSLRLDLGLSSISLKDSKDYTYSSVTHQPFFALGRDSSDVPFGGRNIMMNTMNISPKVTWIFPKGELSFNANLIFFDHDDVTRHLVVQDSADYSLYHYAENPFSVSLSAQSFGAGLSIHPIRKMTLGVTFSKGSYEIEYENLPKYVKSVRDTILELVDVEGKIVYDTTQDTTWTTTGEKLKYDTYSGTAFASFQGLFNPALHFEYEFISMGSKVSQDRELGYIEAGESFGPFSFRALGGIKRNSSAENEFDFSPVYSSFVELSLPFRMSLQAYYRRDTRYPEIEELRTLYRGRMRYPNEYLLPETHTRLGAELLYRGGGIFYGLGLRHEESTNLIKERWVLRRGLESEERAFQLTNFGGARSTDWTIRAGFSLWNWTLYGERGETLFRDREIIDVPKLYYKGSIVWSDRFVSKKLGVQIRFDYQWFGERVDCGIVADSLAEYAGFSVSENELGKHLELIPLRKYLALDFEARMNILSFDLYSRIENLNHSKYMPAIGYTPEGIRFRYGIVWTFKN